MPLTPVTSGLSREDFRCVGKRGVTSPYNSYAHSMAWFAGRLFVGTFRNSLCLIKRQDRAVPPPQMDFWPVHCPVPEDPSSLRAEIISFDPLTGQWDLVHQSVMVEENGRLMPRDLGYRAMNVYQGRNDPHPCLYVGPISKHGCTLLRSTDGRSFADAGGALDGVSLRSLTPFRDKFYTALIGKKGHHGNESFNKSLMETDDPSSGEWHPASRGGFGDDSNEALFDVKEFHGYLYVSTMNPTGGFQIWKSPMDGGRPYRWTRVLSAGGYRGFLNEFGLIMCPLGDCLYVGSGIAGGGYDRVHMRGPAAAEVLRIWPDDSWDVVVGAPRLTPHGMKYPTSGLGPGFDDFLNGYIWYMEAHEGWLYIGTFSAGPFFPFRPHGLMTEEAQGKLASYIETTPVDSLDEFLRLYGGCDLWRTRDGERVYPVTRDGFGNIFNMGIRRMRSTPHGLFVGTSNPFGPLVGVERDGSWQYEPNADGGIEVWLGESPQSTALPGEESRPNSQQARSAPLKMRRRAELIGWQRAFGPLFGDEEYRQFGYWSEGVQTPGEACEALVAELALEANLQPGEPLLDVGCLHGATTRALAQLYPSNEVVGVDELQACVDRARALNANLQFFPMDPARLEFGDNAFGGVFSFEQPAAFDTREQFLREAYRVLKPGGRLALADVLLSREAIVAQRGVRRANHLSGLDAYRRLLRRVGFVQDVVLRDVAPRVFAPFTSACGAWLRRQFTQLEVTEDQFNLGMGMLSRTLLMSRHYLLVVGTKPHAT